MTDVDVLDTVEEFRDIISKESVVVALFGAPWAPQCRQVVSYMEQLLIQYKIRAVQMDAEDVPELCQEFGVAAVPTVVLIQDGRAVGTVHGVNLEEMQKQLAVLLDVVPPPPGLPNIDHRLEKLVNCATIMIFMKGTPKEPRCGFSRQLVEILRADNIDFQYFDVLNDLEVREGLKKLYEWPTYPQVYFRGQLIGGLDILKQMHEDGTLATRLRTSQSTEPLPTLLPKLIKRHTIMVFMKGTPKAPRCRFSRALVDLLREEGAEYDYFDVMEDERVREGLKEYSRWPTYPQVYVGGQLLGGLDIITDMKERGELRMALRLPERTTENVPQKYQ